jgi:threonine synthase
MKYISTRGQAKSLNFEDVVIAGLASDGGLYVPEHFPTFPKEQLDYLSTLSYRDLALEIIMPFVGGEIPRENMKDIIDRSYDEFGAEQTTPLQMLNNGEIILELFHGPTLAFKDVALQFLGNLLDYILDKRNQNVAIVGATSGDTGSAAIYGCRGCKHIELFMLHPLGKVSDVQRMQMTTILDSNIHNLAVSGNFDDCQDMVKNMFQYPEFMKGTPLVAVNSINWARIMAQIVYYFYSSFKLNGINEPVSFCVPTGNFGDIFAGYVAKKMGLPIKQLIVATNSNDILDRFFKGNDYSRMGVHPTVSPSMDIQISSNFERLLFDLSGNDSEKLAAMMEDFKATGSLKVDSDIYQKSLEFFTSGSCDDSQIKETIKVLFEENDYLIDPHTATGVFVAREHDDGKTNIVILATAHPAKFPDVVKESTGQHPPLPEHLSDLLERKETFTELPNDIDEIKNYINNAKKA